MVTPGHPRPVSHGPPAKPQVVNGEVDGCEKLSSLLDLPEVSSSSQVSQAQYLNKSPAKRPRISESRTLTNPLDKTPNPEPPQSPLLLFKGFRAPLRSYGRGGTQVWRQRLSSRGKKRPPSNPPSSPPESQGALAPVSHASPGPPLQSNLWGTEPPAPWAVYRAQTTLFLSCSDCRRYCNSQTKDISLPDSRGSHMVVTANPCRFLFSVLCLLQVPEWVLNPTVKLFFLAIGVGPPWMTLPAVLTG